MPSIQNTFGLLQRLASQNIGVIPSRCTVVRNRNASCRKCADSCTTGCISVDASTNDLTVDGSKCIGCGTCATVCPTGALLAKHSDDAELLDSCLAAMDACAGEAVIACEKLLGAAEGLFAPERVVAVPCLGRADESLLSVLALRGAKKIRLAHADCEACAYRSGGEVAERVVETQNVLFKTWGSDVRVKLAGTLPASTRKDRAQEYDHERRAFFRNMRGEAKNAAKTTADFALEAELGPAQRPEPKYQHVTEEGVLPYRVPDRRKLLLEALSRTGSPADDLIETRLFGHVIIDQDECIGCQMCAVFCPSGALRKYADDDGEIGVIHFPGNCVQCRTCEDVCLRHCLTLSTEVFAQDVAEGRVERYPMTNDLAARLDNHHGMFNAMKSVIGSGQVFER